MAAVLKHLDDSVEAFAPVYARHVWRSAFGDIVIEVKGDDVFVDGKKVERASPESQRGAASASRAQHD
jgi:hypothetical protein